MDIIKMFDIKELAQNFMHSPKIEKRDKDSILMFDYETDTGEYKWTGITFKDTIDIRCTKEKDVSEYMVRAYNSVVEVKNSNWINHINVKEGNYKHYLVYFDGYGAYEFICKDVVNSII
jgi:hypothetical protein